MSPIGWRHGAQDPADPFPGFSDVVRIGGASSVYRAVENGTSRPVALKVSGRPGRRSAPAGAVDAEVQALSLLGGHPNVVTLYRTMTSADGSTTLVLELGRTTLAERLRATGPIGARQAVSVGVKLAGALETAHRAGILHCDVKPQNILETAHGEPVLADFGVATAREAAGEADRTAVFTTLHASPEVLEGGPVSPATDVYGLASTLYQLISGRAPFAAFDGESPASVILRILGDPVSPLVDPDVPIALSDLLCSGLAKDPARRPARAIDLAERLRAVEAAAGWDQTTAVVWGGTTAPGGAGPSLGSPAPPPRGEAAVPGPAPSREPPLPPPAAPAAETRPGRLPSVVRPSTPPRRIVPPGGREPPATTVPLAPLPTTGSRPQRLIVPPAPPGPGGAEPTPSNPPVDRQVTPRPGWSIPHVEEGPLERTVVPDLGPSAGPASTGPAAAPKRSERRAPTLAGTPVPLAAMLVAAVVVVVALVVAVVVGVL